MGVINRAFRNISRRKIRALLVIIALGFSMAILITIPAGVLANQQTANNVTSGLSSAISQTGLSINQTLSQITCSLSSGLSGFGYRGGYSGSGSSGYGRSGSGGFGGSGSNGGYFGYGGGIFGGGSTTPMNESLYNDISSISGVAAVEPLLEADEGGHNVTFTGYGGYSFTRTVPEYVIEGIPLTSEFVNTYDILPTNITAGQNLQAGESGDVLLSQSNAAYFNVGVGQTVNILGQSFQVVGIHGNSAFSITGSSDAAVLYMSLSDAQTITNNVGNVTSLIVYAQNPDLVSQVASAITSLHPELSVREPYGGNLQSSQSSSTTVQESAAAALNQSNATATEEIVIVVAATSLIVLFVMLYTVRERTKEIGTLKAIGFSNSAVMSQFLFEGIILSVIAGVVGIAIGVLVAPELAKMLLPMNVFGSLPGPAGNAASRFSSSFTAAVSVSPELMLIAFGAAVALGALGSLYPAWRAAKISPAEAMRYE